MARRTPKRGGKRSRATGRSVSSGGSGSGSGSGEGGEAPVARTPLKAPTSEYSDGEGNVLTLRGSLTPGARREYALALAGNTLSQEDAWQRAVELLFERLAVRWVIAGLPIERQRDLLSRFRVAGVAERAWIRGVLREHCAEHFPDVNAP